MYVQEIAEKFPCHLESLLFTDSSKVSSPKVSFKSNIVVFD